MKKTTLLIFLFISAYIIGQNNSFKFNHRYFNSGSSLFLNTPGNTRLFFNQFQYKPDQALNSSFFSMGSELKTDPKFHYSHAEKNKFLYGAHSGNNPRKKFYLVNASNGKKVKLSDNYINLLLTEPKKTDELSRINNMECFFDSIAGDSLKVRMVNEEIEIEYQNYFTGINNEYYYGEQNDVYKKLAIKDISYISMKNPFRKTMTTIGRTLMTISVLTIVLSPVTSLNMPDDQRAQRRTDVFLAGVSGVVVAVPFFIIGKNKKYGISRTFPTREKNYWTLKMEYE